MNNRELIENAFKAIMALLLSLCLYILKDFGNSLDKMQNSVNSLNISFATMSERLINQTNRNVDLEKRIESIEVKMEERTKDRWTRKDHSEFAKEIKERLNRLEQK